MPSAQELVRSCEKLVSLPEIFLRVRKVIDDPHSSMTDLSQALSCDPSMTARILQIVNSPFFGVPRKIDTLTQAVNLLGMRPIQNIVLATSVAKAFTRMPPNVMNMTAYWRKSVLCALLAVQFGRLCHAQESERLFIAGLLRDVGHLVLYQTVPERAESALIEASHLNQPLAEVEQASIGCDYAEVGAELISTWGMPAHLGQMIRYQLAPDLAQDAPQDAAIIRASGLLADEMETRGTESLSVDLFSKTAAMLHLSEPAMAEAVEEARGRLEGTVTLIYAPKARAA